MHILSEEFHTQVEKDLNIEDVGTENLKNSAKQFYYLQLLMNIKSDLNKLEDIAKRLYKKLYHSLKHESDYLLKNTELDLYIRANDKYCELNSRINDKKLELEYLEQVVKLFQNRAFIFKNEIELRKMER
jgi:hypothetical protein